MVDCTPYAMTIVIFFVHFLIVGHMYTFGFLIPVFAGAFTPQLTLVEITTVGSLQIGMFYCAYALYDEFVNRIFRPRTSTTLAIGSVLWAVGVLGTSFATGFGSLVATQGILTGIGASICYWHLFVTRRQWGITLWLTSVLMLGGSTGELFFTLVVSNFYQNVEVLGEQQWRLAFQVISATGACGLTAACLIAGSHVGIPAPDLDPIGAVKDHVEKDRTGTVVVHFALFLSVFLAYFSTTVPSIHLVPYMIEREWSDYTRTAVIFIILGAISGRVFIAIALEFLNTHFNTTNRVRNSAALMVFSTLFSMAAIFGWLGCTDVQGLYAFAFLFGFGSGCESSILPPLVADIELIYGRAIKSINTMSFLALIGMTPGAVLSPILAGCLRSLTGDYVISIVVTGVFQLASVIVACALNLYLL